MKIIDYIMFDLTCEMPRALIKEGWQPYGSPYIDKNGHDCQAMVKYATQEDTSECDCETLVHNAEVYIKRIETILEENERLGLRLDALSKENAVLEFRLSEIAKESYKIIQENQNLLHLITECSRCMPKASEL